MRSGTKRSDSIDIDRPVHAASIDDVANTKNGFAWVAPSGGETWRVAARVVRQVASEFGALDGRPSETNGS